MLKIKDNVDLKELEKFGFKKEIVRCFGKCYVKELEYNGFIFVYNDFIFVKGNKTILFETPNFRIKEKILIDDLIQSGLVEKVEN